MKNFDDRWTGAEAIQALFFADDGSLPSGVDSKRMIQIITTAFAELSLSTTWLGKEQCETVIAAVQAVKRSMTTWTPKSRLHSVLWTRWAVRESGLPLNNSFMLDFARWRAKQRPSTVWVMLYRNLEKDRWRGKSRLLKPSEKLVGYTLDQVICKDKFTFDEYSVQWKIQRIRFTTIYKKPRSRATVQVCGRDVVATIRDCVQAEAKLGKLGVLSNETRDGKYDSSVSPAELITGLKAHYPSMREYSDSTLKRGLPELVRSPRGRPGGPRRKKV